MHTTNKLKGNIDTNVVIGGAVIILVIIGLVAAAIIFAKPKTAVQDGQNTQAVVASFICTGDRSIVAGFAEGKVAVQLSDGRAMLLLQTEAASGARFANEDGSIIFWNKGNTAFVTEGKETAAKETYSGCIVAAQAPEGWTPYANTSIGFSISHPAAYSTNAAYAYKALGEGKEIKGVSFVIPKEKTTGTNLSSDSFISVETLPTSSSCSANEFLGKGVKATTVTEGNATISVASSSDAAAGNRYDETVYSIPGTNPCVAVRYFIHSTAVGNYPEGTVKEFDRTALLAEFDQIRKTFVIGR
ncbi:MAG: hypothetical protein ABA06_01190 [Parcubacteria bacterium C7867-001]|nr:MAG: hypothetical protein ABA06_01190 [Parcubacteria bacterium C7867-001]